MDLQNFKISALAPKSLANFPRFEITGTFTDSTSGKVIRDFQTVDSIIFPDVLATMSNVDRRELAEYIAEWLIHKKLGI